MGLGLAFRLVLNQFKTILSKCSSKIKTKKRSAHTSAQVPNWTVKLFAKSLSFVQKCQFNRMSHRPSAFSIQCYIASYVVERTHLRSLFEKYRKRRSTIVKIKIGIFKYDITYLGMSIF